MLPGWVVHLQTNGFKVEKKNLMATSLLDL